MVPDFLLEPPHCFRKRFEALFEVKVIWRFIEGGHKGPLGSLVQSFMDSLIRTHVL